MNKEIKYNNSEKIVIYIISVIVGIVFIVGALLLASALCLAADLPESYSSTISIICVGIGAFVGSYLSSKKIKSGGIVNGLICGSLLYAMILAFSLFLSDSGFTLITLYHSFIAIISAVIGGIIGVNSANKRRI